MTTDGHDLARLVVDGELELVSLSDEQWDLVGLLDLEDLDPITLLGVGPALRSLLAAGLATVTDDGHAGLAGSAALLHRLLAASGPAVSVHDDVQDADGAAAQVTSWSLVAPGVVLRHHREPLGVHRFVLSSRAQAVSALVAGLVPAGAARGEAFDYASTDDPRVAALRSACPVERRLRARDADGSPVDVAVLTGGGAAPWMLTATHGAGSAVPVDRTRLRLLVHGALDAGTD